MEQQSFPQIPSEEGRPVNIGNASNPSSRGNEDDSTDSQLIPPEGEKYLREVANIEDVPDAHDQRQMDETFEEERK